MTDYYNRNTVDFPLWCFDIANYIMPTRYDYMMTVTAVHFVRANNAVYAYDMGARIFVWAGTKRSDETDNQAVERLLGIPFSDWVDADNVHFIEDTDNIQKSPPLMNDLGSNYPVPFSNEDDLVTLFNFK